MTVARVTLAEVDTVRLDLATALARFRDSVLPALEEQPGYAGCYVLTTDEGKAVVLTFWETDGAAEAALASGHYERQVAKFMTSFRAPPGRETYDVAITDVPSTLLPGPR
jgi:heme-degrading monooxygenase HmoA